MSHLSTESRRCYFRFVSITIVIAATFLVGSYFNVHLMLYTYT